MPRKGENIYKRKDGRWEGRYVKGRNGKSYLYAFLEDPQVTIDNNMAERAVKPFVIGRKNWLFSTSPKGAEASAAAYSIINTAQANEFDVKEYLTNIFRTGERRLPLKSE